MLRTADLSAAQQLVVWSARTWVTGFRNRRPALDALERAYAMAGAAAAAFEVDEVFSLLSHGARQTLCFGAGHCPAVHPVEAVLVNCLAAFQQGRDEAAAVLMKHLMWQPEAFMASAPARRWAQAIDAAGWSLTSVAPATAASTSPAANDNHGDDTLGSADMGDGVLAFMAPNRDGLPLALNEALLRRAQQAPMHPPIQPH